MKNQILVQGIEIDSLKNVISDELVKIGEIKTELEQISGQLKNVTKGSKNTIESRLFLIPFSPEINKIDLSKLIGKEQGIYEVELVNIEGLDFEKSDQIIDFQLTLSTQLLSSNSVFQNGLVSYYQYSKPDKGIINSTSSRLMVDNKNPYIFLEGNRTYAISGNLRLKVSGKFK